MEKQQRSTQKIDLSRLIGPSCKSTESKTTYKVVFRNLAESDASVYWIDFRGKPVFYALIKNSKASSVGLEIDTFVTHPWIAIDRKQKQLLAINFNRVFRPITRSDLVIERNKGDRFRVRVTPKDTLIQVSCV